MTDKQIFAHEIRRLLILIHGRDIAQCFSLWRDVGTRDFWYAHYRNGMSLEQILDVCQLSTVAVNEQWPA